MNASLRPFREALMVHFTDSPYSRFTEQVEVRSRGGFVFRVVCDRKGVLSAEIEGQPSNDQIDALSRADDLSGGRLLPLIEAAHPLLAEIVRESGERHVHRRPVIAYRYENGR